MAHLLLGCDHLRWPLAHGVSLLNFIANQEVPYGSDGGLLSGSFDGAALQARLMNLDAALALAGRGSFDGVGIAFFPGCGVVGLDLDHCVTDGELTPAPEQLAALRPLHGHAYTETSMSGTGLHAFALGDAETLKANGAVELFGDKNFIALTGTGSGAVQALPPDAVDRVRAVIEGLRSAGKSGPTPTATTVSQERARARSSINDDILRNDAQARSCGTEGPARVQSALDSGPPPKGRDEWLRLIWAVRDALGDGGEDLARNWSMGDPDAYTEDGFDNVWNSDRAPVGGVTAATLFAWAMGGPTRRGRRPSRAAWELRMPGPLMWPWPRCS
jgi:hypothetical protein